MMLFKTILSFSLLLAAPVFSQSDEEALRDLQVGMAGLQEAAKNPALLAQLLQDLQVRNGWFSESSSLYHVEFLKSLCLLTVIFRLFWCQQDPEMMKEAQKMMENPEFKKQMKKMAETKDFKENVKKSLDMMKDPTTAARLEAQMEHMVKVGGEQLKKGAASAMEEAMASMANPEVMAEMSKMMKDPNFQQQIAAMTKDPSFANYVGAVSIASW